MFVKNKKNLAIVTTILFLAVGCNTTTKPEQNEPVPISKEPTSELFTYSNTKYGFEFKYPSRWKVVNEKAIDSNLLLKVDFAGPGEISENKYTATVSVYLGSSYDSDLSQMVSVTEDIFGKMQDTEIAGQPAKKIITRASGDGKKLFIKSAFMHEGLGYQISSTGWVKDENLAIADVEALLSTFKFLE